jgi:hypothetical protein
VQRKYSLTRDVERAAPVRASGSATKSFTHTSKAARYPWRQLEAEAGLRSCKAIPAAMQQSPLFQPRGTWLNNSQTPTASYSSPRIGTERRFTRWSSGWHVPSDERRNLYRAPRIVAAALREHGDHVLELLSDAGQPRSD